MIDRFTQPVAATGPNLDLSQLVDAAFKPEYNQGEAFREYLATEQDIHDRFTQFIGGRAVTATGRYQAAASKFEWEIQAFAPVPLLTEDATNPLFAIPFLDQEVVNTTWQTTPLKDGGCSMSLVPADESLKTRAYGFYVTRLLPHVALNSLGIRQPWRRNTDPNLGVIERDTPEKVRQYTRVIHPGLLEQQQMFSSLLDEVMERAATTEPILAS